MLPGISGSLIAGAFLDEVLVDEFAQYSHTRHTARQLARWWRRVERNVGPASALRLVADLAVIPFCEAIGCRPVRLEPHGNVVVGTIVSGANSPMTLCATVWGGSPDDAWRLAVAAARATGATWGLVYSGSALRIVDATRTWARRAIEFELSVALTDDRAAVALAGLLHAASSSDADGAALRRLVERSERHGVRVCESLGIGVMQALTSLVTALDDRSSRQRRPPPERAVFEQSITIVYRLLFLLFAEARAAVPIWHHVYRTSYTVDALWHRASGRKTRGLWKAVQAISRLAHAGCRAGDLVVTPFNGRLFSPRHTPLAESSRVPDDVVAGAIASLATNRSPEGRERIAYADLDVEQLGAVYERVLEYEPQRARGALILTRTSHDRKSSGSFYTPRAMTDFLVRRALQPLVENRTADEILSLRVLDPAMGSGAFLVSACRFLARAVERAFAADRVWPAEPSESERAAIRRTVAQRCLFGVDRNPMAVQLARLSLWLCTLSGDRPLTFLDHHLATGDSLIGGCFADLMRAPDRRRIRPPSASGSLPLFDDPSRDLASVVLPSRFRLAAGAENTPDDVRDKERVLSALSAPGTPLERWKCIADVWCASWFCDRGSRSSGVYADVVHALSGTRPALRPHQIDGVVARAAALSTTHRFFHWELEFPEIFFRRDGHRDPSGGFDCVLGNPPWDVLRADTGDDAARHHSRREQGARLRFLRDSGVYRHQGAGHANCYQLFLERALQLARPGGRLALVVPSGLATDLGSSALRRHVFDAMAVDRLIGFDNRAAMFPIHRDVRFLLLTGTKGQPTDRLACAFGHTQASWLDQLPHCASDDPPEARRVVLSRALIDSLDPEHHSVPWLKSAEDLAILAMVLAGVPKLADANGWSVTFGRELNATDDRPHFRPLAAGIVVSPADSVAGESDLLPIVEGKHLEPFRLAHASTIGIPRARAAMLLDSQRTFQRSRIAYRDVASASNRVTLIAAILPSATVSTHTVFCSKATLSGNAQYCLLALLNSLIANYLVRLQVTTHVTTALMSRLPVPRPPTTSPEFRELAALARSLEKTGITGHEDLYARVNAIAARLYGLTCRQYEHVVSTFPLLSEELRSRCLRAYGDRHG